MSARVLRMTVLGALAGFTQVAAAEPPAHIDHVILGVSDLERGIDSFEHLTGVRPAYGGKHPTGTQNALVSLGTGTYLEIIAVQAGSPPSPELAELAGMTLPSPVGWAVSANDPEDLRRRLAAAGVTLTAPKGGSRVTPSGETLRWQTLGLRDDVDGAPFFIVWARESAHPSATSPAGCTLERWHIGGPNGDVLRNVVSTLRLPVDISTAATSSMSLALDCPKGTVRFESARRQP